ncbi:IS630 family transposase [Vibrio sp. 03-59-1]|uniref:IS630 family transposase n=1 Tax=Vibrio sp. 03-59-1 TaxID=2607607 RepID=UPI001493AD40|nr:IS630 family transposase [Vibrio sp. 03-59-1]
MLKKFQIETILKIPGHVGLENVDVWFQDEARFGQQNTTTRLWAERGTRPRVVKQQQFEYAYLFGSVCPAKGVGEAIVVPWVNKDIMISHLEQISKATERSRHAVVIMDGASWHSDDIGNEFNNVSIIKLPPYSPELYNDIVSQVCRAWNGFLECSDRVTKMCSRDWIELIS